MKPHQSRCWLNPEIEDQQVFDQQVQAVCTAYAEAPSAYQEGRHTVSVDEKTGIQALQQIHPLKPMRPGLVERREFEYKRHGTLSLIANLEVATGQVITPSLGPTRTEDDFAKHIEVTVATDPKASWHFIVDNLNIHQSESLIRLVAKLCATETDLGVKGQSGILKSMESRTAFLEDHSHQIRFIYTPKHTSWLNQIEIWFSILVRRLLKRASFSSLEDLHQRILAFIEYFNKTLAKPFRWTYTGRALAV